MKEQWPAPLVKALGIRKADRAYRTPAKRKRRVSEGGSCDHAWHWPISQQLVLMCVTRDMLGEGETEAGFQACAGGRGKRVTFPSMPWKIKEHLGPGGLGGRLCRTEATFSNAYQRRKEVSTIFATPPILKRPGSPDATSAGTNPQTVGKKHTETERQREKREWETHTQKHTHTHTHTHRVIQQRH